MKLNSLLILLASSVATFAQSGFQEFTTSGVFTVPSGVTEIQIEVVGAGGSGGYNGTGGGGGGGYAAGIYTVAPMDVIDITIGTPGAGAAAGTTKAGAFVSASGGENGVSVPNPEIGGGGNPGVGTGGNMVNHTGGKGGGGYYTYFGGGGGGAAGPATDGFDGGNTIAWTGICLTPGGDGGLSGGLPGGAGGKGAGFTDAFCSVTDPAGVGGNYGAGGGGGNGNGGGPGTGARGYCKISWCGVDVTTSLSDQTITANATDASYQWIDCATGHPIDGATMQSYTADVSGNYAVVVTDAVCSDTSECVAVEVITIGIDQIALNKLIISPNPFSDQIVIDHVTGNENYTLFNATGQIVYSGTDIIHQHFNDLYAGVYILKIELNGSSIYKNLVKN